MKNEKGITLIELLAAVAIAGIVIVPLLTIMTGTFTRTISQEKETKIAYVAQEVMEKVRQNNTSALKTSGCWTNSPKESCTGDLSTIINNVPDENKVKVDVIVEVKVYDPEDEYDPDIFDEVKITVMTPTKVVNGPGGGVVENDNTFDLTTVVKK